MEKLIIDLDNPKTWINDFSELLNENNLKIPRYDTLCKWGCCDYKFRRKYLELIDVIKNNKIVLYHGCKTFSTDSYYKIGIPIPDKVFYYKLFQRYKKELNLNFSKEQQNYLKTLINEKKTKQRIFALLVPNSFKNLCSSYIGLGSEWITYLFLKLFPNENTYKMLLSIGKPTVFKIIIPINELESFVCKYVCGEILKCYLDTERGYNYTNSGAVIIHNNIPAKYIDSHFFINKFYSYHIQSSVTIDTFD